MLKCAAVQIKAPCILPGPCPCACPRDKRRSVSGTHHTVRTTIACDAAPPFLKHTFTLNTAMHIDIQTFTQAPLQDSGPFFAVGFCFYRICGPLAAAAVSFGRKGGARRGRLAAEGPHEYAEERLRRYYRVEVQPQRV